MVKLEALFCFNINWLLWVFLWFLIKNQSCGLFFVLVDIISSMGFEKSGDYLAVGDRGGRVVIFERKDGKYVRINHTIGVWGEIFFPSCWGGMLLLVLWERVKVILLRSQFTMSAIVKKKKKICCFASRISRILFFLPYELFILGYLLV